MDETHEEMLARHDKILAALVATVADLDARTEAAVEAATVYTARIAALRAIIGQLIGLVPFDAARTKAVVRAGLGDHPVADEICREIDMVREPHTRYRG